MTPSPTVPCLHVAGARGRLAKLKERKAVGGREPKSQVKELGLVGWHRSRASLIVFADSPGPSSGTRVPAGSCLEDSDLSGPPLRHLWMEEACGQVTPPSQYRHPEEGQGRSFYMGCKTASPREGPRT